MRKGLVLTFVLLTGITPAIARATTHYRTTGILHPGEQGQLNCRHIPGHWYPLGRWTSALVKTLGGRRLHGESPRPDLYQFDPWWRLGRLKIQVVDHSSTTMIYTHARGKVPVRAILRCERPRIRRLLARSSFKDRGVHAAGCRVPLTLARVRVLDASLQRPTRRG